MKSAAEMAVDLFHPRSGSRRIGVRNNLPAAHRRTDNNAGGYQNEVLDDVLTFERGCVGKMFPCFKGKKDQGEEGARQL